MKVYIELQHFSNHSNWIDALLNIMILILGSALITIGENIKGFGIKQTQ